MTGDLMHGVGVFLVFFVVLFKQDASGLSLHTQVNPSHPLKLLPPNPGTHHGPVSTRSKRGCRCEGVIV
jgi:hypothetical protein